jgi:predicted helicase
MVKDFLKATDKFNAASKSFFAAQSLGTATNRDVWVYNYSIPVLQANIRKTIKYYNEQVKLVADHKISESLRDAKKGNWTRDWENLAKKNYHMSDKATDYRLTAYRPFAKLNSYFADDLNQERYQLVKLFPTPKHENLMICVSGIGVTKEFSAIIMNLIPDLELIGKSQCFSLFYYDQKEGVNRSLFDRDRRQYARRDGITDFILAQAKAAYGNRVTKEDIFYYVYGFLHSPEYRRTFSADLKKMLPRLPLVEKPADFWAFAKAGRALAELHLGYETVPPCPKVRVIGAEAGNFRVEKMRFAARDDKTAIQYNAVVRIGNIPPEAYEYVVNGRSAIEWTMERYQVRVDKASGIRNDPNDWGREHGNPRYILDLLLSVIAVSLETVKIVAKLPKLDFDV